MMYGVVRFKSQYAIYLLLETPKGGIKKKMKKLWRSRKALSPVVAAIILIAVTVAVSIAVAAWMGALTFTFMRTEELKIKTHTWVVTTGTVTDIELKVTNTGTATLTLDDAQVNNAYATNNATAVGTLNPGDNAWVKITYSFSNDTKYDFAILTKSGNKYTYMAKAPS
jgi:flagellin-like protein